jgi:hypothetical protein
MTVVSGLAWTPFNYVVVEGWLREITYKKGWAFSLVDVGTTGTTTAHSMGPSLIVKACVADSNTGNGTWIEHIVHVSPWEVESREAFLAAVLRWVCRIEAHEAMEFFKVGGKRLCDPHQDGQVLYAPS